MQNFKQGSALSYQFCSLLFLFGFFLVSMPSLAQPQRSVWFCPTLSKTSSKGLQIGSVDYSLLFTNGKQWERTSRNISVFKTYRSHIIDTGDAELRAEFAFLSTRGIKLAVEYGPMNRTPTGCGAGIEGWANGGAPAARYMAKKIKQAGGELAYVAMDEPFWGDRHSGSSNSCHLSDEEMVQNAALTVQAFRESFPSVEFGDIEPVQDLKGVDLPAEYGRWLDAWQHVVGTPMAFFHADVTWAPGIYDVISRVSIEAAKRHVRFGLIYNGNTSDATDQAWLDRASARYTAYEADGRKPPDDAVFQSWEAHPAKLLPEDQPFTHTAEVLRYLSTRGLERN